MTDIQFRSDVVARIRDNMGGDESVIEAMLVSTDNDQLAREMMEIPKTRGRIRFLMRKKHGTPFEHNALKFYVEAPIFVFREWHRHRIGMSYNEQSGRYSELPPMFYVPARDRPLVQVGKPGDYHYEPGDEELYEWLAEDMRRQARMQYHSYQHRLERGIAKEVARMSLGVNIYSKMYCTLNARSMMAFLSLRTAREAFWKKVDLSGQQFTSPFEDPDDHQLFEQNPGGAMFPSTPMWEIEQAARLCEEAFASLFPLTYEAYNEFGRVCP